MAVENSMAGPDNTTLEILKQQGYELQVTKDSLEFIAQKLNAFNKRYGLSTSQSLSSEVVSPNPSPASAHQGPGQGRSDGLGFPENSKDPEDPAAGVRSSQSSRFNSGSSELDLNNPASSALLEKGGKNMGVAGGAQSSQGPGVFSSSSNVPGSEPQSQRRGNCGGHTLDSLPRQGPKQVSLLSDMSPNVFKLTTERLEMHNALHQRQSERRGSLSQATTVSADHSNNFSSESVISSLSTSSSSSQSISEKSGTIELAGMPKKIYSGSIGGQNTATKVRPSEKPIGAYDIRVTYRFTDADGTIQNHETKNSSFCHSFSADAPTANTTQDSALSSSSGDATPPKYHTVSVAWGDQDTAQNAGAKCMEEYLGVMGLKESPGPDNVMNVIELLEKEWVPEGSKDASSGQDIDVRLAALFEKIPINAHPDQRERFRDGAKEVFMDTLQPALDANYQNNQTSTNRGVVGGPRSNRLEFTKTQMNKFTNIPQDTKRRNSAPPLNNFTSIPQDTKRRNSAPPRFSSSPSPKPRV